MEGPFEDSLLLIYGASSSACSADIKHFVEDAVGCKVYKAVFAVQPGKILLEFDKIPSESYNIHLIKFSEDTFFPQLSFFILPIFMIQN